MSQRKKLLIGAAGLVALWPVRPMARAMPTGPALFCNEFSSAPACEPADVQCTYCHSVPPQLNLFGSDVQSALQALDDYTAANYADRLPAALDSVTSLDSDGDGISNRAEILKGSSPSLAQSNSSGEKPVWDAAVAFRRVLVQFCGNSPSYDEARAFEQASDKKQAVHEALTKCLESTYWKDEELHRLADNKIKPIYELGLDGPIVLADYKWDYRLFSYVLTGNRDARDLLLADYHVKDNGEVTTEVIARQSPVQLDATKISLGSGQPVKADRRAGMITTQWFIWSNTMFSRLPRTTAAQAYRAYLGLDIASNEGLFPIEGEPRDVDDKQVAQAACAVCHSTLDPLAYAFSTYNGIESVAGGPISIAGVQLLVSNVFGNYNAGREPWESDGSLFGEPVADLRDWADKAAQSDEFKRNLADTLYTYAVGRKPDATEQTSFEALWRSIPQDGYSANKLIQRVVEETVFGSL